MRKSTPTTFDGSKLRSLREKAGWSPDDLAANGGPHLRSDVVEMYEAGKRQPSFDRLQDLAAAFGVSIDELLNRDLASSNHHWYREAAGLPHAEVADPLGVHRSTVKRWDTNGEIPRNHLEACAKLYNTTPENLASSSFAQIKLSLSPSLTGTLDERRGKQTRERFLMDLVTTALDDQKVT